MNRLLEAWVICMLMMVTTVNTVRMSMALTSFNLLLTIVKTKLARVLGRLFYPLWSVLSLAFVSLFAVRLHRLRTIRQLVLSGLEVGLS